MDDGALIERVSVARVEGADDEACVRELLRRASEANRAALDRLAKQSTVSVEDNFSYLGFEDFLQAASEALAMDVETVRRMAHQALAESAINSPEAGFGRHEEYTRTSAEDRGATSASGQQPCPPRRQQADCAVVRHLVRNINSLAWEPPSADNPDGAETAEIVEAATAGSIPYAALTAWVNHRLVHLRPSPIEIPPGAAIIYGAEYVGELAYGNNAIRVGDLVVHDVHGYNPAAVYVRRISGKTAGISVAEIIISAVGDGYAQEELDAENAEAARYPLGPKEYWRAKMVGKYRYGTDQHLLTAAEFEADWEED